MRKFFAYEKSKRNTEEITVKKNYYIFPCEYSMEKVDETICLENPETDSIISFHKCETQVQEIADWQVYDPAPRVQVKYICFISGK